ncbi:unnamed protein product [Onchocerca flexuosa]|uniref:Lipocalin-like domain-containing protein n=1 Tax=Onchocerca flexuosa TaxID=387005 RepID=A0A183H610_9BILA|nr:unnamed protein product [Onchocerca flexuosa]
MFYSCTLFESFVLQASQNNWPGEADWMENGKHILSKENTLKNEHAKEISAEGEPVWVMRYE